MSQATQLRDKLLSSEAFSKYLTGVLTAGGTAVYFDWVDILRMLKPETAGGVVAVIGLVKLAINWYSSYKKE